jgi:hypothetical protein
VLLNYVTFFFFWYITEICSKLFLQWYFDLRFLDPVALMSLIYI